MFILQYCGKLFPEGTKMRRHVNEVHEKVKEHMCNTCGKCFARKDKLRQGKSIVAPFCSNKPIKAWKEVRNYFAAGLTS